MDNDDSTKITITNTTTTETIKTKTTTAKKSSTKTATQQTKGENERRKKNVDFFSYWCFAHFKRIRGCMRDFFLFWNLPPPPPPFQNAKNHRNNRNQIKSRDMPIYAIRSLTRSLQSTGKWGFHDGTNRVSKCHKIYTSVFLDQKLYLTTNLQIPFEIQATCTFFKR